MDGLLAFFSNLILITAGLVVMVLWIVFLILVAIEIYDMFTDKEEVSDEEDYL